MTTSIKRQRRPPNDPAGSARGRRAGVCGKNARQREQPDMVGRDNSQTGSSQTMTQRFSRTRTIPRLTGSRRARARQAVSGQRKNLMRMRMRLTVVRPSIKRRAANVVRLSGPIRVFIPGR
jgi:hypothetical protein